MITRPLPPDAIAPGVVIQDLIVGRGALAQDGDRIRVHYVGKLLDGSQFDSSRDRRVPLEFALGMGAVMKGLDEGVKGMRVGGLRKLTIPPEHAVRDRDGAGVVPPRATLVYDVELLKVE
jgi:FKBP-type peptidyl-prolyl cis-trans isomerase